MPCEKLKEDKAQGPEISCEVIAGAEEDLWGLVLQGTHQVVAPVLKLQIGFQLVKL